MEKAYCPHCETLLEFDAEVRWKNVDCPACGKDFMVDPTLDPPPLPMPSVPPGSIDSVFEAILKIHKTPIPNTTRLTKSDYTGPTFEKKFSLPDREPLEDEITEKQFNYILHLCIDIDPDQVRQLGKWQASSLINQLKTAKELMTEQDLKNKGGCMVIVLGAFAASFYFLGRILVV